MADSRQLATIKARLLPELDEPYFEVEHEWNRMASKRCDHRNSGVRLEPLERRVICKGCGTVVDAFDALVNYAASEQRLIGTRRAIEDAKKSEEQKKAREKERRPFARQVTGYTAKHDLSLKAEPIIGYALTLACGHQAECGPNRQPRQVTCRTCEHDARKASV